MAQRERTLEVRIMEDRERTGEKAVNSWAVGPVTIIILS